jgi:hypothetical protein
MSEGTGVSQERLDEIVDDLINFPPCGSGVEEPNEFAPCLNRIDPNKPYNIANVRIICYRLHKMLAGYGLRVFLTTTNKISRRALQRAGKEDLVRVFDEIEKSVLERLDAEGQLEPLNETES